jgi:hypothetical protein
MLPEEPASKLVPAKEGKKKGKISKTKKYIKKAKGL